MALIDAQKMRLYRQSAQKRTEQKAVEHAQTLLKKAVEQDEDYYDGVALNLYSFYTGTEQILEEIAKSMKTRWPCDR